MDISRTHNDTITDKIRENAKPMDRIINKQSRSIISLKKYVYE